MKKILVLIAIAIIAIGGFWVYNKYFAWQEFKNPLGFTLVIPHDWDAVSQNNQTESDFFSWIFISKADNKSLVGDKEFQSNPLLAVLDKNISFISFSVVHNNLVSTDLSNYLKQPLSGAGQNVTVDVVTLNQIERNGLKFFFYTKQLKVKDNPTRIGAIWTENGNTYNLEADTPNSLVSDKTIEDIALSFRKSK